MALAQETEVLLLDEPTTFLDPAHQLDVLDLLAELNRNDGRTVVAVLHDLNQAFRYADHVIAMRTGSLVATGAPEELATPALIHEVFGLRCRIIDDPVTGTPMVVPIGRHDSDSTSP
jgi:iron complex transport system ATP-binding protein